MLKNFCQKDPRWQHFLIPGTDLNISGYGCCVCCLADLASYAGKNENPLSLTPKLRFINGLVYWNSLTELYPQIIFRGRMVNPVWADIKRQLDAGSPVIVRINLAKKKKSRLDHWVVLIRQLDQDNFLVADPLQKYLTTWQDLNLIDRKIYVGVFYDFLV